MMATSGPDPNRAEVDNPPCRECKGYSYHSIECTLNVERVNVERTATPTTLWGAIHAAIEEVFADCLSHSQVIDRFSSQDTNAILAHPAMQAWLRANDEALVALADSVDGYGRSRFITNQHAAAIAAARERLRG